jgi:ribosomal protein S18 acetylase RimI-like enzyme
MISFMSVPFIRDYHPKDLPELYRICLLTGDSGQEASGLYQNPDLLGAFYAAPYAVFQPDMTLMLEDESGTCGYVLGVQDSLAFQAWMDTVWLPPLRARYPLPPESDDSRDARMIRVIHQGYQPFEQVERYPAHLHIDLLPRVQGGGWGRRLMEAFLDRLRASGVPGVHLGVGKRNPGAVAFYERLGFVRLAEYQLSFVYGLKLESREQPQKLESREQPDAVTQARHD